MPDRQIDIAAFLSGSPWENWKQTTIAGDASARRYLRIMSGKKTAILMDAPPVTGENTERFVNIAIFLRDAGFNAPEILKHDQDMGFLLLEDLGQTDFAKQIATNPQDAKTLYSAATDILVALHATQPPANLTIMSPEIAADMIDVAQEWYLPEGHLAEVKRSLRDHLTRFASPANRLALRDFHVENLIWRSGQVGLARVGLLDFQDAFLAPTGYDLASLLRDARRVVDPETTSETIAQFVAAISQDPQEFQAAFHCLAVQRNLRILGIFSRLAIRDGKLKYLTFVQHVWSMILDDLQHPALSDLRYACKDTLPPPNASRLKGLL